MVPEDHGICRGFAPLSRIFSYTNKAKYGRFLLLKGKNVQQEIEEAKLLALENEKAQSTDDVKDADENVVSETNSDTVSENSSDSDTKDASSENAETGDETPKKEEDGE